MKTGNILFTGAVSLLLLMWVAPGCKKEPANNSFTRIVGTWKEVQIATDDNGDGVIEAYEIHNTASGYTDLLNFRGDSTGTEVQVSSGDTTPVIGFVWNANYGDSLYIATREHDTTTFYLAQLNSSTMALTYIVPTDSGNVLSERLFNKQ